MQTTSPLNKNIMIGLGAIVLIAVIYLVFFNTTETPDLTSESASGSTAELFFINLAGTLEPIAFDAAVFADSRFTALVDLKTAIVPEKAGRSDPFAPIPGVTTKKSGTGASVAR